MSAHDLLQAAYAAFNARSIDEVLKLMASDVAWPNGMEGGYVHGHEQVAAYWTRQWEVVNPRVTPLAYAKEPDSRIRVHVRQVVKDICGVILLDQTVDHVYSFEDGKIKSMEIRTDASSTNETPATLERN